MPDEIDQLRTFRADTSAPSAAAWSQAEEAIAAARRQAGGRRRTYRLRGWRMLTALIAVPVLAAAVLAAITFHSTTKVSPGNATSPNATASGNATATGDLAWSLAGYLVPKGWQLNTHGPVPGPMTCPTATTCYVEGEEAGLYVSTDAAATWQSIKLPAGLTFTTPLVCQSATTCEAGATVRGTPALTVTKDGGRGWSTQPLPAGTGTIDKLTCPAPGTCRAITLPPRGAREHLLTTDDGRHFTASYFPANNVYLLSCPTASHCVAAGLASDTGNKIIGQLLISDDGGASWHSETMAAGIRPWTTLDCVDAEHCVEVVLHLKGDYNVFMVSDDGGVTWTARPVPANLPHLGIRDVACVSVSTCYITGFESKPQRFDGGHAVSEATAIAAVTQDAGRTWQAIGLPEPSKLPAFEPPDAFMSVSSLQCPQVNVCIAMADTIAGNKYAAIYKTAP